MQLPDAHPSLQRVHMEALMGAEPLPATAVGAACVFAKPILDDVVTYLRAGEMPPKDLRHAAAILLGLSTQLALHADLAERELVRAAAVDGSEL